MSLPILDELRDAARYRAWRDAMIAGDLAFIERMQECLPDPESLTAADVDAAVDHALKG